MTLHILGSGSSGNCYLLDDGSNVLVIEAGLPLADVLKAINYQQSRICGVIVTHEHGDHAGHVREYLKRYIPVMASAGTLQALGIADHPAAQAMQKGTPYSFAGGFKVMGFDVQHDAGEPYGFLIDHPDSGVILFATDTYYLKYRFIGLRHVMLECNYAQEILDMNCANDRIDAKRRQRTMKSHMSLETCKRTLAANDLHNVQEIVLIHLSSENADALRFEAEIGESTSKPTYAANAGLTIKLTKYPF